MKQQTTQKEKKEFSEMSKKEKKEFLSNDLIERMIRVEQKVLTHFNEHVPYNKTEYYKSLTEKEKERFENYLRKKGKKNVLLVISFLIPLLCLTLLKVNFTGRVIEENITQKASSFLSFLIILFVLIFISIVFISFTLNKLKDKRFESHVKVIENILLKKEKK